ncbi:MAG: DUF1929 domain-containing protein [Rhizobacter sp.]
MITTSLGLLPLRAYCLSLLGLSGILLLASCGGGQGSAPEVLTGSGKSANAAPLAEGKVQLQAKSFFPTVTVPADAHVKGMWSPVYNWPGVAVHAVLLPDSRVLSYGSKADGTQTGSFNYNTWDSTGSPALGHMTFANSTGVDIFCGSQLLLPPTPSTSTPAVFLAGGDNWNGSTTLNSGNNASNVFSASNNSLTRAGNMQRSRWYSTSTTLTNGETYIQSGLGGTDRPEIRSASGVFRTLNNATTNSLNYYYPRNFVMPDGRLFGYDANGSMYFINTTGDGGLTAAGSFAGQYGSPDASAAMFRPGRILQFGGNSNGAIVIDVTSGTPVVTPTQSMSSQRRLVTGTLLADGQVLATGGSQVWNELTGVNTVAEIWNPQTGQWLQGAAGAKPLLYHSNALLLPDASVLITGGGGLNPNDPNKNQLNAQIYYPPYFFQSNGGRASRPSITTTPDWLEIGKTFALQTSGATSISRVTLLKTGSSTHGFNMEQRFVDLAFSANGGTLTVQAPTKAGEATPGFYMVFVFDQAGVPSESKILRLGVAANPNPSVTPVITNPGARTSNANVALTLQVSVSDPNGDALRYSATGLPTGLSLNATTGLITGTPTANGSYNVVVAASDGINSSSASFVWTITSPNALTLTTVPTPVASVAGGSASFNAAATGEGVQYQWRFGDGTADSAWSSSGAITHLYANPGTYVATLTVRDSAGAVQSRSFAQTVYLPATAKQPTASSNIVIETPTTGNARLWVVNQDNESITAFDAVTRAKLGEVTVGVAPRSIAVAPNGLLWVSNKDSATVSVVDPASRTVVRTIALPRASQPFGVAMSPTAAQAFVVLEATGQVLKFDAGTYAQTGSASVGANARHVSVAADGVAVYVSRFITPPLPGEGTATVSTPASAGGEVVQLTASSMATLRTIVLKHSDKPDAESQGRGIPNYLAAATISPDGTQAYVPSKQDNIKRGSLRDSSALNFQSTVRAISSRLVLTGANAGTEDLARRVDHDNASLASAVVYEKRGTLLFVALETSREVAVVDAHSGVQLVRFDVGRAPQGLALSNDGTTLFVNNFMDRTVGVYDLKPLLNQGLYNVPVLANLAAVATERLPANVLLGKQHFYDARDVRLARDRYMSCASCHNDGGQDGRVWDLTHAGEGLRNTISLRGRAGSQGRLHWSANFNEVQDFEAQIRALAGGAGLMTDAQFNTGTRNQPLGDNKTGVSSDLDALAAYVASLSTFPPSPRRNTDGSLTTEAVQGKTIFQAQCLACHGSAAFTQSASVALQNVGTLKPSSGQRLYAALTGIDAPTLRDAWATGPYLHDGSAPTLSAAISAHTQLSLTATQVSQLASYVSQIGSEEGDPSPTVTLNPEAEAGTLGNGGRIQTASNASGGRVIGNLNNLGAFVQVTVSGPSAVGNATLVIRFSNGYGDNRSLSLYVNGVKRQQVVFPTTGGWNNFANTAAITIPLNTGSNTIRLQRDASDTAAADIDRFTVTRGN